MLKAFGFYRSVIQDRIVPIGINMKQIRCPYCNSLNISSFEWIKQIGFQYWTCWECDRSFAIRNCFKK